MASEATQRPPAVGVETDFRAGLSLPERAPDPVPCIEGPQTQALSTQERNARQPALPYMKGQPYWNVDMAVFKSFDLGGDKKLQLRLSAYNVLNHPIAYPDPNNNLTLRFENGVLDDPRFGWLPTEDDPELGGANKAGRRIVQLAVRFTF
jgi:hypothetical protein